MLGGLPSSSEKPLPLGMGYVTRPPFYLSGKEEHMEFYKVDHYHGHYVARNGNGDFVLSADTEPEAWHELELMEREWELD